MKNTLHILTILSLFFISCHNEALYSCDPEIDKWTKSNLPNIRNMTRADFLSYNDNVNLQKSIYSAMTCIQKIELWTAKINDVLKLSWNEKERAHIESLLVILNEHSYFFDSKLHGKYEDEIALFSYNWINYAQEKLGWRNEIYAIGATPNPIVIDNGAISVDEFFSNSETFLKTRSEHVYACNCNYTTGCPFGFSCYNYSCALAPNCGLLGLSDCIGMCGKFL